MHQRLGERGIEIDILITVMGTNRQHQSHKANAMSETKDLSRREAIALLVGGTGAGFLAAQTNANAEEKPNPLHPQHGAITMDDVIIIGGSFAGLAAALQLGRARRKVLSLIHISEPTRPY